MNNGISGAPGAIPVVNIIDYLQPEINRPDMYYSRAYPVQSVGAGTANSLARSVQRHDKSSNERSPIITLFYTIGLIILSAAIFLTLAAWSNVLLSWYDGIFVNHAIDPVTTSRFYFAITLTAISIVVIIILLVIWYYFTLHQGL